MEFAIQAQLLAFLDENKVLSQWLMSSRLILNQSKTKGNYCKPHQTLCCRSKVQLSWEHTDSLCNKVNKCLGLLARIRSCRTLKAAKCV
ncbi:unnamed protein product [Pocillopora meandrina]|uniref:Uncharacterized protein n=1 Tax=Pocillopora meandrina TaxID=46732 RepID=A0AAU9W9P3_9CNID|nr:unnamed protein product [Pocillopora meandrina]